MKKTLLSAFFLVLLISFTLFLTANAHHTASFPDVSSTHPNYVAIEYFRVRNLVKGLSDGKFHPGKRVSRAKFIAMVLRVRSINPHINQFKNCYSDVKKQWFADEICYAKSEGWLDGMGSLFHPKKKISALEAYRIVTKAFSVYNINAKNNLFGSITRADAAQMMYQVMWLASVPAQSPANYNVDVPPGYPKP